MQITQAKQHIHESACRCTHREFPGCSFRQQNNQAGGQRARQSNALLLASGYILLG